MPRKLILKQGQSPGDIVMLTAAVRDLHLCHPGQFITDVRTPCPALWENNPHITPLRDDDPDATALECHYPIIHQSNRAPFHFIHGFIRHLNETLSLSIAPTEFKGDIHLSEEERSSPIQLPGLDGREPYWIVVAGGKYDFTAKWWGTRRYQQVVDHFRGRIQFVQVGEAGHHHEALQGVVDLRGKTDLRGLIRLVYRAAGVLCPVTLAMHLAAAVETPPWRPRNRACVVIAGGREPSHWEAYTHHQFLHTNGALRCCEEGGCWRSRTHPLGDGDEKDRPDNLCSDVTEGMPRCLSLITPESVIRAVELYYQGGALTYVENESFRSLARPRIPTPAPAPVHHDGEGASPAEPAGTQAVRKKLPSAPPVTICVLTYGDYAALARRCIDSVRRFCDRDQYRLFVGANAVGKETWAYLSSLLSAGEVDRLFVSPVNINKCPMMRRMFEHLDTEYVWWFDDDSFVESAEALPRRLQLARSSPPSTVAWGHRFYWSQEHNFNHGLDAVEIVRRAPWYRGLPPPSWETGDGRWFFLTGGSWMLRTTAIRALNWPDPRLIKAAEDVLLCEAIRQQGWDVMDIGPLGVAINKADRRGQGEDQKDLGRMLVPPVAKPPATSSSRPCCLTHGAFVIPTSRDTDLLEENFGGGGKLPLPLDGLILDENDDADESNRVRALCEKNGWRYRPSGRSPGHGPRGRGGGRSGPDRSVWETLLSLADDYDFVVRMGADTCLVDPSWCTEVGRMICGRAAAAGTIGALLAKDTVSFWQWARARKLDLDVEPRIASLQAGIYGLSRESLLMLRGMDDPAGRGLDVPEHVFLSCACRILGIPLMEMHGVLSFSRSTRHHPNSLRGAKVVQGLRRSEWEALCRESPLPAHATPTS